MVRLSMKAKKAAATIKRLLRAKRSQFSAERTKMIQCLLRAQSEGMSLRGPHQVRVRRGRGKHLRVSNSEQPHRFNCFPLLHCLGRHGATRPLQELQHVRAPHDEYEDEDSTQQNGVDGLDHASRDFSFRLGHPHYINPGSRNPVRQLPKLDFLELARAQRNELQSESGVELKEGEEWALAPEEIGPARFPYELSYSDNYVAAPQVERRRSI
ncbi:hypothetical protein HDK77DRAFT_486416 [Phyllosticta capitalensis]|uniref:uncharacterized protein n=1 Tax=Phyllosticta capitalensis TaxID=121624 RepID=UPI00312D3CDD